MGGKRGRGKDSGGGQEDQYGGGWSGGHRDHFSGPGGGGGSGGGGMTGGGGPVGKAGSGVTYQRQPKVPPAACTYCSAREVKTTREGVEDYGHSDELAKYGDEDDIAGNAQGSRINPGSNQRPGAVSDVEERGENKDGKGRKGKRNRAFRRSDTKMRSKFHAMHRARPDDKVFYSNSPRRKRLPKTLKRRRRR